jgi:hypothetical protein
MESLRIRSPQRGTKVIVTGGTPPKKPSFFPKWMPEVSATSQSLLHKYFSRESTYASQEAKKGGQPHSHTFGCQGCNTSGARHDPGICGRSLNGNESPVVRMASSVARFKGGNASTTALSPLDGPKSQRTRALLSRSEQAIAEPPFLGPLEFEENSKAKRSLRRTKSRSDPDYKKVEKPESVDYVEEILDRSLVKLTVQDSHVFPPRLIEVPAVTIPPRSDKIAESRSKRRFKPSVDRISEKSVESEIRNPDSHRVQNGLVAGEKGDSNQAKISCSSVQRNASAEQEDIPDEPDLRPLGTSSKRQGVSLDPKNLQSSGRASNAPNSRSTSPERLESERYPHTIPGGSFDKDSDITDFALPSPIHPQLAPQPSTSQLSEPREGIDSSISELRPYPPSPNASNGLPISVAGPTTHSQSFEDIDEYPKNNPSPRLASVDSCCGNSRPPLSLLIEKSLGMESPLPRLDSYEISKSGKLSATIQDDSDEEGEYSIPRSFPMASQSRIIAELLKWDSAKKETKIDRNQSFEDIDEVMARPETLRQKAQPSLQGTPSPTPFLMIEQDYFPAGSLDQSTSSETMREPIPIPTPHTLLQDPLTPWDILFLSTTPPMPGSWPSNPSLPSSPRLVPSPPPNSPPISDSWQELPIPRSRSSSFVHLRGGGGGSALGILSAMKYVPDIENGKKLLDKKITGCDSYFALGWGKGMTYREFSVMMKKRADREKEIEKEKQEKAEAEKKAKLEKSEAEKKRKAEEGALKGVLNKMKGVFGIKGKKDGGEQEQEPAPENAPAGGDGEAAAAEV